MHEPYKYGINHVYEYEHGWPRMNHRIRAQRIWVGYTHTIYSPLIISITKKGPNPSKQGAVIGNHDLTGRGHHVYQQKSSLSDLFVPYIFSIFYMFTTKIIISVFFPLIICSSRYFWKGQHPYQFGDVYHPFIVILGMVSYLLYHIVPEKSIIYSHTLWIKWGIKLWP